MARGCPRSGRGGGLIMMLITVARTMIATSMESCMPKIRLCALIFLLCALCMGCAPKLEGCSNMVDSVTGEFIPQTEAIQAKGLPNLFKVSDDLYRSAQPEEGGMTSAKNLGIKTVISLRETELDSALNEEENAGLNLIHYPIITWDVTDQNVIEVLKLLRDAPKPILVHCRHGADRTGLTVALYRIVFQGWAKECAKNELVHGGYGFHSIWRGIPLKIDESDAGALRREIWGTQ